MLMCLDVGVGQPCAAHTATGDTHLPLQLCGAATRCRVCCWRELLLHRLLQEVQVLLQHPWQPLAQRPGHAVGKQDAVDHSQHITHLDLRAVTEDTRSDNRHPQNQCPWPCMQHQQQLHVYCNCKHIRLVVLCACRAPSHPVSGHPVLVSTHAARPCLCPNRQPACVCTPWRPCCCSPE